MKKIIRNKKTVIATIILSFLYLVVGIVLWKKLPEQMVIRYDFEGKPDAYAAKSFAIIGMGILIGILQILLTLGMGYDPKEQGISDKIFKVCLWIIPFTNVFIALLMYGKTMGANINIQFTGFLFAGILFVVLGNYMPKTNRNSVMGIRTRATLNDEKVWNRTNRISGWCIFVSGLILLVEAFISLFQPFGQIGVLISFLGVIGTSVVVSLAASVIYSKKN